MQVYFIDVILGVASYKAPKGEIKGEISLKRQYEIKNGKLDYFIDSNLNIIDDGLRNALSKNTSSKMKNIVETIQREQDIIIRDESDLLIVQGVAGSGKTSIALHRVAFLMYQGLLTKIYSNNIIIISPNDLFGNYISDVLPELGEENIKTVTFEYIFKEIFANSNINIKSRNILLEEIISTEDTKKRNIIKSRMEFKSSKEFVIILQRLIWYFEHRMIEVSDIYYNGIYIEDKTFN